MIKQICHILNSDTEFKAITGKNKANVKYKAYAGICPKPEDSPYVVVRLNSKPPVRCKGGRSGTYQAGFSVHCFHKNYDDVVELANAVDDALDQVSGTILGYTFKKIVYSNQSDGAYQKEHEVHQRIVEFETFVDEDIAT